MIHHPSHYRLRHFGSVLFCVCLAVVALGGAASGPQVSPVPELACPSCNDNNACTVDS